MNIETTSEDQKTYHSIPFKMTTASDLLQRHFQTLVEDNAQWQTLIADDVVWELPYAPAIGHPAQLSGREEVVRHVTWFVGAVENFRFYDLKVHAFTDPGAASPKSRQRGLSNRRGVCISRITCCSREAGDKIAFLPNILILCVQLKRWIHRFLFLNHDDKSARIRSLMKSSCIAPMTERRPPRRQPEDHNFGSLLMLAVTAGAFLLTTWIATKAVLFFLQSLPFLENRLAKACPRFERVS